MPRRKLPPEILEQECRDKATVKAFLAALETADIQTVANLIPHIEYVFEGWRRVMKAVARINLDPPLWFRQRLLSLWVGDGMRAEVNDDLLLLRGLPHLFPPYNGPALTLYRGEQFAKRRDRTYGLAWSRALDVAWNHANGRMRCSAGGSVVLMTEAPADAIICDVAEHSDAYGEDEVLVDRRRLKKVHVLERFTERKL